MKDGHRAAKLGVNPAPPPELRQPELDRLRRRLARADSLEDCLDVRAAAEELRRRFKAEGLPIADLNEAEAIKLRAERKCGCLLAEFHLRGGDHRSNGGLAGATLRSLGIHPHHSSRWQREAAVPEEEFERLVAGATAAGQALSSAALLRLADQLRRAQKVRLDRAISPKRRPHKAGQRSPAWTESLRADRHAESALEMLDEARNHGAQLARLAALACDRSEGPSSLAAIGRQMKRLLSELADIHAALLLQWKRR